MTALDRARIAWGELPDWVEALAEACDRTSQARAAGQIGYSAAVVSQVLRRCYPGDLGRVEQAVRGAFLARTVSCPGRAGEPIPTQDCVHWQRRPYDGGNHVNVAMYRACRSGCPHSRIGSDDDQL